MSDQNEKLAKPLTGVEKEAAANPNNAGEFLLRCIDTTRRQRLFTKLL
jgi:hypothetical protein